MRIFIILFFLFSFFIQQISAQYNSVLSSGEWYKISTNTNGIYKLDYSIFSQLGLNLNNLKIDDIKVYGNGGGMLPNLNSDFRYDDLIQIAIKIHDNNDNGIFESNDYWWIKIISYNFVRTTNIC